MRAPDDAAEEIAALLDRIARNQRRESRNGLVCAVTYGQFRVLRALGRADHALRLNELAAELCIVPRSATSVVDDLESAGLLTRNPDPNDRRAVLVILSSTGAEVLTSLRQNRRQAMAGRLTRLAPNEQNTLIDLLERLAREHPESAPG